MTPPKLISFSEVTIDESKYTLETRIDALGKRITVFSEEEPGKDKDGITLTDCQRKALRLLLNEKSK
jgi:hypothetical protein